VDKQIKTYQVFGDSPVLDILHICFQDLEYGRMTPRKRLFRLMLKTYSKEDTQEIKNIIRNVTVDTNWFSSAGPNIHLIERGVEVYVNMIQHYSAEEYSEMADRKTNWIIFIALGTLIASIALLLLDYLIKK
jgi:hypothetical protein